MAINDSFKALSDPTRRKILDLLKIGALTAGQIAEQCESTKPNISQHLTVLKEAGLIRDEKRGQFIYYWLNKEAMIDSYEENGMRSVLSIKEKILSEIKAVAQKSEYQLVMGADAKDEGTAYVMDGYHTKVAFDYIFQLNSFKVSFQYPVTLPTVQIEYGKNEDLDQFLKQLDMQLKIKKIIDDSGVLTDEREKLKTRIISSIPTSILGKGILLLTDSDAIKMLKEIITQAIKESGTELPLYEQMVMADEMIIEITGLGKLHSFMDDPTITEIMVNKYDEIWIERKGKTILTDVKFDNEEELIQLIRKMANASGRRIDNSNPILQSRLPDGSTYIATLAPISYEGATLAIKKFSSNKLTERDLLKLETLNEEMLLLLQAFVKSRVNIIVTGGTGTGKTTTLNILSNFISENERIITIEDSAELKLENKQVIRLESRPPNSEGEGEISIRDLAKASLRMMPNRIIIGELRDGVAFDLLQAMNTGHDGSMSTVHANNSDSCAERVETLVSQSGLEIPEHYIRQLVSDSIEIIITLARLKDGSRKITQISEVIPPEKKEEKIKTISLFEFRLTHINDGKIEGKYVWTGQIPSKRILEKLKRNEYDFEKLINGEE